MRVHALGVYRMNGTSKKSGNAYDMAKLVIQVPVEIVATQTMKRVGHGYGAKELDLEPEALAKFGQFSYPCDLDLEIGSRVSAFGLEAVVIGAKVAVKAAA
jgi:hypothetical protein